MLFEEDFQLFLLVLFNPLLVLLKPKAVKERSWCGVLGELPIACRFSFTEKRSFLLPNEFFIKR
jgi:hypothetical protein